MQRRTLLTMTALGTMGLAGCLGGDSGGEFGGSNETDSDGNSSGDDPYPDLSETERAFVTRLDRDIDVVGATPGADELTVTVQTTGTADDDIQMVAEVYLNFATALSSDLRAQVEDRGLSQLMFVIRQEWATQLNTGEIDSDEYLTRIVNTRNMNSQ
ncbi:MAG: hypothetical protein J07HN6_01715 [Halonotius sp. J07HN6]|nr:MAG: hypothetical protein J07HN6_01715 [Halonotius sp. J07HN6]ERH05581.1 MAG: hypothetical protein J07HN4v3_01183 [Halonotius sp. J07HN4]